MSVDKCNGRGGEEEREREREKFFLQSWRAEGGGMRKEGGGRKGSRNLVGFEISRELFVDTLRIW
jgi:hypothetical protein